MSRARRGIWIVFCALWLGVSVGAFTLSRYVIALDQSERSARKAAVMEENLRLSLWRLDSYLSPLLADASLEPPGIEDPGVVGQITSDTQSKFPISSNFRTDDNRQLRIQNENGAELSLNPDELLGRIREFGKFRTYFDPSHNQALAEGSLVNGDMAALHISNTGIQQNQFQAKEEFNQRAQNFNRLNGVQIAANRGLEVSVPYTAIWSQGCLLLVRPNGARTSPRGVEGYVVDWGQLSKQLTALVSDLLPDAVLVPIESLSRDGSPDMLASLPVILQPGASVGIYQNAPSSGMFTSHWIVGCIWASLLTAIMATAALLLGLLKLNDKRAMFVAAVTHELRTPLTTIRLYSEMLNDGLVTNEAVQKDYIGSLHREVERISHLVENVFVFARLDISNRQITVTPQSVEPLIERIAPRLEELCRRSEFQFTLERCVSLSDDLVVKTNESAVEQILFNLVDNACKYARNSSMPHVVLGISASADRVSFAVKDFGAGFPPGHAWKKQFSKSVERAAETAPGIGLGLSICSRLARRLGGELSIANHPGGGVATLSIPRASAEIED